MIQEEEEQVMDWKYTHKISSKLEKEEILTDAQSIVIVVFDQTLYLLERNEYFLYGLNIEESDDCRTYYIDGKLVIK